MIKANTDLRIISGDFLHDDLPSDKEYLRKYFHGDVQSRFLVYFIHFRDLTNHKPLSYFCHSFMDHTGIYCDTKWIYKLLQKVMKIEHLVKKATEEFDLESLAEIKSGRYNFNRQFTQGDSNND